MTEDISNCKKIEYYIFIILIFLQNFAIIATEEFGISGSVCFLFLISILNFKIYYQKIKQYKYIFGFIILLFISSIVNNSFILTQILRVFMIILLIYMSSIYIERVYEKGHQKYFWKAYTNIMLVFLVYGIYEMIANIYSLPLLLNIFSNNPSYGTRGLYRYYGGWIEKTRLYNTFFEPSVFSVFIVYNLFLVKEMDGIPKRKKKLIYILTIYNLIFTYSRTGYVTFIYMIAIYVIYKYLIKNKKSIIDLICLLLPFVNLMVMYFIGLNLFDDLSSLGRTYSGVYYLKESFSSIKYALFGHSAGSLSILDVTEQYIEKGGHNGYVDILYQYGIFMLVGIISFMKDKINKVTSSKKRYLIIGVFSTFCCFESYYSVESIVIQIVLIYTFCKYFDKEEIKE